MITIQEYFSQSEKISFINEYLLNKSKTKTNIICATDDTIKQIVKSEIDKLGNNANLNHIDVSEVTDMSNLFYGSKFNGDISKWNVSNVTNMNGMFDCSDFNGDISKWDVSNVTDMTEMFGYSEFNKNISKWDVSNVTKMNGIFNYCPIKDEYKPKFK